MAESTSIKTTTGHTFKAAMIAEKDRAIVLAAREHFLRDGFSGASIDGIAKSAGVSVKTIYSHFENKNELFSKVMIAACSDHLLSENLPSDEGLANRFAWFREATQRGLMQAGQEYLRHLLSEEQQKRRSCFSLPYCAALHWESSNTVRIRRSGWFYLSFFSSVFD